MSDRESVRRRGKEVLAALALLTRLPLPRRSVPRHGAGAAWAWPVAGALTGVLAGAAGWVALGLGLPPGLAALVTLTVAVLVTGALHEDGLADAADALAAGDDRAQALAIMKDSRMGAFGTLALVLVMLARWEALSELISAGRILGPLVAAGALSRAAMTAATAAMPTVGGTGLSAMTGRPTRRSALAAAALGLALALVVAGGTAVSQALAVAVVGYAALSLAQARLGGQTGDVLGAAGLLAETAALVVAAA